jgi:hypothetical protein
MRASEDVDMFMHWAQRGDFDEAVDAVIAAYDADEMTVWIDDRNDTFARLIVSDGSKESKVELSADWRANEPLQMAIGPVLHPDDAVANKMCALFARGEARDFVDVDAALQSGRYTRDGLIALAKAADGGFNEPMLAIAFGSLATISDAKFAPYGVQGSDLVEMRARFAEWRDELQAI